jgi:hypothetical protein
MLDLELPRARPALAHLDGRAAREAARQLRRGEAVYPRLVVVNDSWVLIESPTAPLVMISATEEVA